MSKKSEPTTKTPSSRLLSLDYLRGYFIAVIIIDHLWRFPSLWALVSGKGMLWMSAAEGFVMISGFLIGYIRGFKGLKLPFLDIAKKLLIRAGILYVWMLIVSMGYIAIEWSGKVTNMPFTPLPTGERNYWDMFVSFATSGEPHMWIHFLYLYAIFLVLAIGVVALLRKRQPWLVLAGTLLLYLAGLQFNIEWMKWQVVFFLPSLVGFYFDTIRARWTQLGEPRRRQVRRSLYGTTLITMALSVLAIFWPQTLPSGFVEGSEAVFDIELFSPLRVLIAGLWFTTLAFVFERITPFLHKYTYGIIEYLGTHSLTAYIAHGYVICLIGLGLTFTIPTVWATWFNTLLGLLAIIGTYLIIRAPILNKVLPK